LGEKATQLLGYKGLPAAADFLFKILPKITKIWPKLSVSQQNKTYVVTLYADMMLHVVPNKNYSHYSSNSFFDKDP
jgi:hypothetical protein